MTALLCFVVLISSAAPHAAAQGVAEEYRVKAAFLFHFVQLVDWPVGALNGADNFLSLCIFDDEPGRQEFQNLIEGKATGSRVLHLRLLTRLQDIQGCNIVFLSRAEARRQRAILRSLRGVPVLTVGETDDFLSDGGMIRFHIEQDRIRFDINLGAADLSQIKVSSRLLLLASAVNGGGTVAERGSREHQ